MPIKEIDLLLPKLHQKQAMLFETLANEPLYGGATRGGKSFAVRYCNCRWAILVPNLQLDIFRLSYDDVIANHMQGPYSFPDLLAPLEREGLVKINKTEITFWHGSIITLQHANDERVMLKHQGVPKQVRTFEECTQIPSFLVRWLRAWMTVTEEMKDKLPGLLRETYPMYSDAQLKNFFPKILHTTNPIGVSAHYYKKGFVKAAPPETLFEAPLDDGGFSRIYIPARVEDNPSEDAQATMRRVMGMGDEAIADALLNANWDAMVGDFFPQYDARRHEIEDFDPPAHWFKFITYDWGSSDPFAVIWWCISDGEEFEDSRHVSRWYPRGSLIAYREWYGADPKDSSKGLQMRNEDVAHGILSRTQEKWSGFTVTDSLPFQDRGFSKNGKKYNIADVFFEAGLPLTRGNTARIHGWSQVRDRLIGRDGLPLMYFMQRCSFLRDYLPSLPRHKHNPEDAADSGEATHMADACRLAATTRPLTIEAEPVCEIKPSAVSVTVREIVSRLNTRKENGHARR